MTRDQVRTKINELLENTPENVLNEVLEYLKSVKDNSAKNVTLSQHLRHILSEDKELLERLAK